MDPIITETVIKSIAGSDFSAEDLLVGEKPVTVYLRFPELHLHALSPLIRLVWSSIIDELYNAYDEYKRACAAVIAFGLKGSGAYAEELTPGTKLQVTPGVTRR